MSEKSKHIRDIMVKKVRTLNLDGKADSTKVRMLWSLLPSPSWVDETEEMRKKDILYFEIIELSIKMMRNQVKENREIIK